MSNSATAPIGAHSFPTLKRFKNAPLLARSFLKWTDANCARQRSPDGVNGIGEEVGVMNTDDGQADGCHVGIAGSVLLGLLLIEMNPTIEFDHELVLVTVEIRHVFADLVLATKFEAHELPISEQFPHHRFRRRLLLA